MKRKILAFLVTPVVIPIWVFVIELFGCMSGLRPGPNCVIKFIPGLWVYTVYGIPIGWIILAVLGIPSFLFLRGFGKLNAVTAILVGAVAGTLAMIPLYLAYSAAAKHSAKFVESMGLVVLSYGTLMGATGAILFYVLGFRQSNKRRTTNAST